MKNSHASNDPRLILCLDGLEMSFVMLENIFSNLHAICAEVKVRNEQLPEALMRCWFFIDIVHRLRSITQTVPGLSKKKAEVKVFLANTAIAEKFRHYVQHLNLEISKLPSNQFPIWGSLSWVDLNDPQTSHTVGVGSNVGERNINFSVYDVAERKWCSKVSLSIFKYTFNFDGIFEECMRFREFIVPWIQSISKLEVVYQDKLQIDSIRAISQ